MDKNNYMDSLKTITEEDRKALSNGNWQPVKKYLCRNCGKELFDTALYDEPTDKNVLYCHNNNCKERIMRSEYGYARISEPITSCHKCPNAHLGICDSCSITDTELGFWIILPDCPLKKVPYDKEQPLNSNVQVTP